MKTKKPDARIYLLYALFFLGVIIYHFAYSWEIMGHPYMKLLIFVCFGFFGVNLGKALSIIFSKLFHSCKYEITKEVKHVKGSICNIKCKCGNHGVAYFDLNDKCFSVRTSKPL